MGEVIDAIKLNVNTIKGELTKKPEELPAEKLEQAKGLAKILTELRKFLYLFFSFGTVASLIGVAAFAGVDGIIQLMIMSLSILYLLFKVRDYLRGTI